MHPTPEALFRFNVQELCAQLHHRERDWELVSITGREAKLLHHVRGFSSDVERQPHCVAMRDAILSTDLEVAFFLQGRYIVAILNLKQSVREELECTVQNQT